MKSKGTPKHDIENVEVRQWYGASRSDTLAGHAAALEILRAQGFAIELGPWEPAEVVALGFWARGEAHLLEAFGAALEESCLRSGTRVAAVDYAGATT